MLAYLMDDLLLPFIVQRGWNTSEPVFPGEALKLAVEDQSEELAHRGMESFEGRHIEEKQMFVYIMVQRVP